MSNVSISIDFPKNQKKAEFLLDSLVKPDEVR